MGEGADGDAAARGSRLQPRRGIDGVAGEEAATGRGVDVEAHEGFAGVDADSDLQWRAIGARHGVERLDDPQAGANGAFRVVLVDRRHAEDADRGVADELLDGAAVRLDHLGGAGEVLAEQGVHVFGVGGLAHRREGDDIAEERGNDLAFLGDGKGDRQRRRALGAEGEIVRRFEAAARAGDHLPRLSCPTLGPHQRTDRPPSELPWPTLQRCPRLQKR